MTRSEKYDKIITGAVTGFLFPFIIGLIIYLFSPGNRSLPEYIHRIIHANIVTHAITLCVFPNIFFFLFFNRLDMLLASRGILGITFFWALIVFGVKFFG